MAKKKKLQEELHDEIDGILAQRHETHGDFEAQAAICQGLLDVLYDEIEPADLEPCMRESLYMSCHKFSRILAGDATEKDHWQDIVDVVGVDFIKPWVQYLKRDKSGVHCAELLAKCDDG